MADLDDPDVVARIEHLAQRCTHAALPCPACTNLSVWAVSALASTGWLSQARRYHNRSTPQ